MNPSPKDKSRTFLKSSLIFSGMTLVSRVLGLLRDMLIASYFNITQTDAFFIALRIPNTLRRFFAEGSFSSAFTPVLGETKRDNPHELNQLINTTCTLLTIILLIVTTVGVAFADKIIPATDNIQKSLLAQQMLVVTFPYILFISLSALLACVLNLFNRFALSAFVPALLNITLIVFIVFFRNSFEERSMALAWGVLLAGLLQFLVQLPAIYHLGIKLKPALQIALPGVRKIFKLMIPTLIGASAGQINILINTLLAASLTTGSVTWLYYSERLIEFPIALIGVALGIVILPKLSQLKTGDPSRRIMLSQALQLAFILGSAAALGLIALAYPLISTLFVHGEFDANDAQMVSHSLQILASGAFFLVMIKILTPAYYATQNTKTPMRIALISIAINVILSLSLYQHFGYLGLAFSSCIAAMVNASLLTIGLIQREFIHIQWLVFFKFLLKILLANALLYSLLIFLSNQLAGELTQWHLQRFSLQLFYLLTLIAVGIVSYFLSLWGLGIRITSLLAVPQNKNNDATQH